MVRFRSGWPTLVMAMLLATSAMASSPVFEFPLGRFGSRAVLDPCPQHRGLRWSTHGTPDGEVSPALIGAFIKRRIWPLPFHPDHPPFRRLQQEVTPTSVTYIGTTDANTLEVRLTIRSPFYPGDERASTAPAFLIDIETTNVGRRRRPCRLHFSLPLGEDPAEVGGEGWKGIRSQDAAWTLVWPDAKGGDYERQGSLLRLSYDLGFRQSRRHTFALVTYRDAPVAEIDSVPYRFSYTRHFGSADDVAAWAIAHHDELAVKCRRFDETVTATGLPEAVRNLASMAFQTFAASVYWLTSEAGDSWVRAYDSTQGRFAGVEDLAYQLPFLESYWPQVAEHARRSVVPISSGPRRFVFAPDLVGEGESATHDIAMREPGTASEAASLLAVLSAPREDRSWERVRLAARRILADDRDGDGIPEEADDTAERRNSVALGWRSVAALRRAECWFRESDSQAESELAREIEARLDRLLVTLEESAFVGDHYALVSNGSDEKERGGTPEALGGLVDLLRRGDTVVVPTVERIRSDSDWIRENLMTSRGPTVSVGAPRVSMVSAVIRDLVSAHAGVEVSEGFEAYWSALVAWNQDPDRPGAGGFTDDPGDASGGPSFRGIVAFEVPSAFAGLRSGEGDLFGHRILLDALSVPLIERADWDGGRIPWIQFRRGDSGTSIGLRNRALLAKSGDLYERLSLDETSLFELDLLRSQPPRLRDGRVEVLTAGADETGWWALVRGEPGVTPRVRATGLPEGRYRVRVRDGEPMDVSREELAKGVPLEGAIPDEALDREERVEMRQLRSDLLAFEGDEGIAKAPALRSAIDRALAAVDRRLEWNREARSFAVSIGRGDAGERVLGPREIGAGIEVPNESVEDAMESLLLAAPDRLESVVARVRPYDLRLLPADENRPWRISMTNRFLPRMNARLRLLAGPHLGAPFVLDAVDLAPGESEVVEVALRDEPGDGALTTRLEGRLELQLGASSAVERLSLPVRDGHVRGWLVSRFYAYDEALDFGRSESAEWDPRPSVGAGDANWRLRTATGRSLERVGRVRQKGFASAYASVYLVAPEAGEIEISGKSRGRVRMWIGAKQVYPPVREDESGDAPESDSGSDTSAESDSTGPGPFAFRVTLEPGASRLLVKLEEGDEGWGIRVRVRSEDADFDRGLRAIPTLR